MTPGSPLFIQKRPARAGAQTSLARLTATAAIAELQPIVLTGTDGWLTATLRQRHQPVFVTRFPSPRSLPARLLGLHRFARRVARLLAAANHQPRVIVANDHQECPLALALARALGNLPVIALLRSAAMTRTDFTKYRCAQCSAIATVGEHLQQRVASWSGSPPVLLNEGFAPSESQPLVSLPQQFPRRLLVIGGADPAKGFTDFIEALDLVEAQHPDFPAIHCDFTSAPPPQAARLLAMPRRSRLVFAGRAGDLAATVRGYPLAVHPSRAETFGMAPLEAILAGVPTLMSTTGIVPRLNLPAAWQFPPANPAALAAQLANLWQSWPPDTSFLADLRLTIASRFNIATTAATVAQLITRLAAPSS